MLVTVTRLIFSFISACGVIQEYSILENSSLTKNIILHDFHDMAFGFQAFFGPCWTVVECLEECVCVCVKLKMGFCGFDLLKISLVYLSLIQMNVLCFSRNKIRILMKSLVLVIGYV